MKKLLGILVLGLLLSSNANAKIIELKKCSSENYEFNPNDYEKHGYVINREKSLVQRVSVFTDRYYEEIKKEFLKKYGDTEKLFPQIRITNYKIKFSFQSLFDNNFIKAVHKWTHDGHRISDTLEIDIKKKRVAHKIGKGLSPLFTQQCE